MSQDNTQGRLNEQEIQFKKRARRRLVGAIALVLIMVAVLPMVLDDRTNKAPPQDIAITIPSQDGAEFTSKITPVAPAHIAPLSPSVPAASQSAAATNKPAEMASEPVEPKKPKVVDIAKPEIVKPEAIKPAQAKNEAPKKEQVAKVPEIKKPVEAVSTGSSYVQIGVFSDAENVKQLQQKLASQGLKSYTEKMETPKGEKTRLRLGPFISRVDAENALAKVKGVGLGGMVVSK